MFTHFVSKVRVFTSRLRGRLCVFRALQETRGVGLSLQ